MANKTNNKPHVKNNHKLLKKPAVSLTNEQYEEIFNAAIYPQKSLQHQLPAAVDSPRTKARSSSQSASVESSSQNSQDTTSVIDTKDSSSLTTLNSEDFVPLATSSNKTSPSNRWTEELTEEDLLRGPPKFTSRKEKLLWLQEQRGTGLYVKCDNASCGKWRWITNPDPEDLPRQWFCFMHPDKNFGACNKPEKTIPSFVEGDLIHNCYTTGSIVWAKLTGYPWWPAMVDDCPDTEMYYWIDKDDDIVPDWYHVVFLDKESNKKVSRCWVHLKNLKSFKSNPYLDKKLTLNKNHKSRINAAKRIANAALQMSIKERLKKYSFLALWDKEIPEYTSSDETEAEEEWDEQKVLKKKIIERKKSNRNRRLEQKRKELRQTSSDSSSNETLCLNVNKSDITENNRTEHNKELVECENLADSCSEISKNLQENVVEKEETKTVNNEKKLILNVNKSDITKNNSTEHKKELVESKDLADNCSKINKNLQENVVEKEETKPLNNEEELMLEVYKRCYTLFTGEMGETKFGQLYKYITGNNNTKSEIKSKNTEIHIEVKKERNEKMSAEDSKLDPLVKSSHAKEIIISIKSEIEETKTKFNNNDPNLKSLSEDKSEKTNEGDSTLESIIVTNKVETSQKQIIKIKRPENKNPVETTENKINNDLKVNPVPEIKSEKTNEADSTLEPMIVKNKAETSQKQRIKIKRPENKNPAGTTEIKINNDPKVKPISAEKSRKIREADSTLEPITKKLKRSFKIPLRKNSY